MEELTAYLRHQLDRRRSGATDDLIGALMVAEEAGDRLSAEEALATCVLLLIAGNETTTNLIGNAVVALNDHDLLPAVAADPGLIPAAVEETLRHQPPVLSIVRSAVRDVELGGKTLPAGAFLFVVLAAANRDPSVFPAPERFDITRNPNPHLGFGGRGAHYCIGANQARVEIDLIFNAIADHMPGITKVGEPRRLRSGWLNGIKEFPVRYA